MAALDAQSNWNIEMSKPFQVPIHSKDQKPSSSSASIPMIVLSKSSREIPLPSEIISHILSYIPHRVSTQRTFWACTLVSRTWYSASIELLYERPYLTG